MAITILSEQERYRLHCKRTDRTETFCKRPAITLVYINTVEQQLPPGYFCPECYNGALGVLKGNYPQAEK